MSKQARTNEANTMANLSEKGELEESEDSPVEDLESESAHSSSNYSASKGSSDEESEDDVSLVDSNIEVPFEKDFDYNSDIPLEEFHDSSSCDSSDHEEFVPELSDQSDSSGEESDEDPINPNIVEDGWTEVDLDIPNPGVNLKNQSGYPVFDKGTPPGPINIPPATSFPCDYFHLYFNLEIMADLVSCTNSVAEHFFASKLKGRKGSHLGHWTPTSVSEIYRYFGILLHMGIKKQPTMRSYWSQDLRYSDAFVKKAFTRDRFEKLKKFLHVVKPHEFTVPELKEKQMLDPFWRLDPLLWHLGNYYQRYFHVGQDIDIDEMCIGFKGRHIARCYNPKKPNKWHLKAFCLNDSTTGYLHRFYMYSG